MIKFALFARLEAKPGKEAAVREFLEMGLALANQEATTPIWFALKLSESTFGVFDAFENEAGRQAHLEGPIAQALMTRADELFAARRASSRLRYWDSKTRLMRAELKRSGSGLRVRTNATFTFWPRSSTLILSEHNHG